MMISLKSLMDKAWRSSPQMSPTGLINYYSVGDITINNEPGEGTEELAEDSSESKSEDDNSDEANGISDDASLKEEDKESLLLSFLTMSIDNDVHYTHQLS